MKEYDIVVIGSGSGMNIVDEAVSLDLKVAVVDKGPLGGTCLNLGCIPSKMLIFTADRIAEIQEAGKLGIEVRKRKFGARFGSGEFADKKLILLKPWQFMNRSGQAVATAVGFYKLSTDNLLVITDDMDLEPA